MLSWQVGSIIATVSWMDYLHTNYRNFSACRMLPRGSSAMSNTLIILLPRYSTCTGYLLDTEFSLRFHFSVCYKALNGQAPDCISDFLKHKIPSRYSLRTNDGRFLLQWTKLRTLSTLGDRCFTLAGPELWNSLPLQIRSSTNISPCKRRLTTFSDGAHNRLSS